MVPLFLGELGEPQGQEGPRALATKGPTEEVSPHRISTSHTTPFPGAKQRSWRADHRAPVGRDPTQTGALEKQPGLEERGGRRSLPSAKMRSHKPHQPRKHGFHAGMRQRSETATPVLLTPSPRAPQSPPPAHSAPCCPKMVDTWLQGEGLPCALLSSRWAAGALSHKAGSLRTVTA